MTKGLDFTKSKGNDLSTPNKDNNFPGLKPGDNGVYVRLDGQKHITMIKNLKYKSKIRCN